MVWAAPSFAYHWVEFIPCGYDFADDDRLIPDTVRAPHFDKMYVHRGHIVGAYAGDREAGQKGPPCSVLVLVNGVRRPVVGTLQEVMDKLRGSP